MMGLLGREQFDDMLSNFDTTYYTVMACPGGAVVSVAVRAAYGDRRVWLLGPGQPDHLCQVTAAYALRLNSWAGTECPL